MVFCSIRPLPEHCHESSAGTSSFSLSSHFFTAYKDFFPSCPIPVLELDPLGGGYWLAVVVKCPGTPGSVRAAQGQRCLQEQIHPSVQVGFISSAFSQPQLGWAVPDDDRERDTPKDESLQDALQAGGCVLTNSYFHLLITFSGISVCHLLSDLCVVPLGHRPFPRSDPHWMDSMVTTT